MFDACDQQQQCNGTTNANVCKSFGNKTLCYCNDGFLEFRGKCVEDKKMLGESCEADIQCSGTDNAGICGKYDNCSCSIGFLQLQQKCVEMNRQIFESCDHSVQCNGTENATLCKDHGIKRLCYCDHGYLEVGGVCLLGQPVFVKN
ncbi:uncharacterized protein LOC111109846 isoform X2 [Crassostrea virginica]